MTNSNIPEKRTKRFRIGRFLYYQYCNKFLFWANDLYISIWNLRISICWDRTFVWSKKTFRKLYIDIFWYNHKTFKRIWSNGSHYKMPPKHPEKHTAEMEEYYNTL